MHRLVLNQTYFFDHYTVSRTKTSATIKFGADIRQVLQAGTQAKPDFHFSLSGSLSERIRDARFILAVSGCTAI